MEALLYLYFSTLFLMINGHAIFWEPPSRASLGKHNNNFCSVPVNHDHMSLYCGGVSLQHMQNGGKCGICGDPYGAADRPHEVPGKYATGIIGRSYFQPGQIIDVYIDVVANHKGFFAFKLCPNNDITKDPSPACFDRYRLPFENGDLIYYVPKSADKSHSGQRIKLKLKLPDGVQCWHCILQWTYVSGNNWGSGPQSYDYSTPDCTDGSPGKVGCGPQETFRGCADICIGPKCTKEYCQIAKPFQGSSGTPSRPVKPIITTTTTVSTTTKTTTTTASTTTTTTTASTTTTTASTTTTTASTTTTTASTTTTTASTTTTTTSTTTTTTSTTTASTTTTTASTTTTATVSTITPIVIPPIMPEQICVQTGIKEEFYSTLGQQYCRETCQNQVMDLCNLYICYCNTSIEM